MTPTAARMRAVAERRPRHPREGDKAADGGPGVASGGTEASLPRGEFGEGVTGYNTAADGSIQEKESFTGLA